MATLFRDEEVETLLNALDALERSIRARPKNSRGEMDPMDCRPLAMGGPRHIGQHKLPLCYGKEWVMDVCERVDRERLSYHVRRLVSVLRRMADQKPYTEPDQEFVPERDYNYSRHEIATEAFKQGEARVEWECGEVAEREIEIWENFVSVYAPEIDA